jgi:hypothetical protein
MARSDGRPSGRRVSLLVVASACMTVATVALLGVSISAGADEQGRTSLIDWGELGADLDNNVPQRLNAGAADVGGVLVRKHEPSGRLPGWGGGSHFLSDGIVALHRDMKHDLGFTTSRRARATEILRRQQRARSLARARAVLRRERQHLIERKRQAAGVHLQQMALRRRSASHHVGITERTIEEAYRRAARLSHRPAPAANSGGATAASKVQSGSRSIRYDKAAKMARTAADAVRAPRPADGASSARAAGAVGVKTAAVLDKAADALKTITDSLNSGSFNADPNRMSKMAASLASLSQALGDNRGVAPAGSGAEPRVHAGAPVSNPASAAARASHASAAPRVPRQERRREEKIEEDILYHLGQLRLLPPGNGLYKAEAPLGTPK